MLSVIKVILFVAAVVLTTANRTYAAHSGAECYFRGHRMYVPDGFNYPRQAWAGRRVAEPARPYGHCRSESEMTLMRALKTALDPDGTLNPGKVI